LTTILLSFGHNPEIDRFLATCVMQTVLDLYSLELINPFMWTDQTILLVNSRRCEILGDVLTFIVLNLVSTAVGKAHQKQ
jgi:hypothetical protein